MVLSRTSATASRTPGADTASVLRRALLVWEPPVAVVWLRSPNAFLGDARPIDLAVSRRAGEVLGALDAALAGAYA